MITLVRFGLVNSTPIEMASSRLGMDSMTSTIRMMTVSTQPPNAPARMPRISPPISPIRVARMPTSRVCRAPTIIRESRSRPWVSPPSGKPGCGGAIAFRARDVWPISNWAPGSCGAIHGAMMASTHEQPDDHRADPEQRRDPAAATRRP